MAMKKTMTPTEMVARLMGDRENAERAKVPFGIAAQEMDGQNDLMARDIIPRLLRPDRETFEKAGFVFGKMVDGLFIEEKMPEGWTKKANDDALHSDILDGQGRRRGTIFYRAAFHDRDAHASLACRYGIRSCNVEGDVEKCELTVWDYADGKPVHSTGQGAASDYAKLDELRSAASLWLEEHFADSRNPLAYW
jgi:hypothetical protein